MKQTIFWLISGLICSLMVFLVVLSGLFGNTWITDPEGIPQTADTILLNIRNGNWEALQEMVVGSPDLNPDSGEEGSVEKLIYDAYLQSLDWTCQNTYGIQGARVTQTVSLTCLDIVGVTEALAEILKELPAEADPENQEQALHSAAKQLLEASAPVKQHTVTLMFQREQKQWRVIPDTGFLSLLSGFPPRQR